MPAFFVPGAEDDPDLAERIWLTTKLFAQEQTGWEVSDRRVFRVEFVHNGQELAAEVGQTEPLEGEQCIAILESNSFLVCTPNRGVDRGFPILVGDPDEIVDFD